MDWRLEKWMITCKLCKMDDHASRANCAKWFKMDVKTIQVEKIWKWTNFLPSDCCCFFTFLKQQSKTVASLFNSLSLSLPLSINLSLIRSSFYSMSLQSCCPVILEPAATLTSVTRRAIHEQKSKSAFGLLIQRKIQVMLKKRKKFVAIIDRSTFYNVL